MATYFTDQFELNKCGSSANPFLVSWDQTDSVFNCSGTLNNITISGGTPPYTFELKYPDGTISNNVTNLTNLCEGQYTAVTTDSLFSSTTSFITIQDGTTGKLTSSLTDDSCTTNVNQFCEITVSNFDHQNSDHFTYLLYKDNNLYETYQGSTGQEVHIFSNLRHGNYTLTAAYDGNSKLHT